MVDYKHACPEWDFLVIDKNDPEIMGCVCSFTQDVRRAWYTFCSFFEPRVEPLTLYEITKLLGDANCTEDGDTLLSQEVVARIAYSLGHADAYILDLQRTLVNE